MASNWQTLDNVFTVVRDIANKDITTLPDTTLIPFANKYYFLMIRELVDLRENLYCEISNTDLEANQREYPIPVDSTSTPYGGGAIKIQRVEVSYDGSSWEVAEHIVLGNITTPTILNSDIAEEYSKTSPRYYFKDRSIWLIPTPETSDDVANGNANLYIFWTKRPGALTAASELPDLPKEWLAMLQEGILYEVLRKFSRTAESRDALQNWHLGIEKMRTLEANIDSEQKYTLRRIYKNYR